MRVGIVVIRVAMVLLALAVGIAIAQSDWPSFAHDPGAQRYSPVTRITPANVSKLVEAWRVETRPASAKKAQQSKTTPLMVNNTVYLATPYQSLVAVEADTGKTIWTFDHKH